MGTLVTIVCTDEKLRGRVTRVLRNLGEILSMPMGILLSHRENSIEELADD